METLVILDATEDDSEERIRSQHPNVRVIADQVHRGPLAQHNRGARETSGEVIVWLDDDAELRSPMTLSETLRQFTHPRVGAVGIPYVEPSRGPRIKQQAPNHDGQWLAEYYLGCCAAVRRTAFEATGGFDETMFIQGDEPDICAKMLSRGWITVLGRAEPAVHHVSPKRDNAFIARYATRNQFLIPIRYGRGLALARDLALRSGFALGKAIRTRQPRAVLDGAIEARAAARAPGARSALPRELYALTTRLEWERRLRRPRTRLEDVEHILPEIGNGTPAGGEVARCPVPSKPR